MKIIKSIILFIELIITGLHKFVRDYARPAILFIQGIKKLVETEIPEDFKPNEYFIAFLRVPGEIVAKLLKAFKIAIKQLLPDLTGEKDSYAKILAAFANHVKTLEKRQRSMLYIKTAALMIIELISPRNEISESEADLLAQITYSWLKNKNQV